MPLCMPDLSPKKYISEKNTKDILCDGKATNWRYSKTSAIYLFKLKYLR